LLPDEGNGNHVHAPRKGAGRAKNSVRNRKPALSHVD
jgi:hypothetical protein